MAARMSAGSVSCARRGAAARRRRKTRLGTRRMALRKGVRVGYVPQDPVFAPGRSVEEVVLDALRGDATLEDYEKSARVAQALGKAGFADRAQATDALSGGWRKRLAIARELAAEPD